MKWDAKMIAAVVSLLSIIGGGCTWLYTIGEKDGKLSAQVDFNSKHEKIVDELITLRITCNSSK